MGKVSVVGGTSGSNPLCSSRQFDLARRLKADVLDFEQAITELKRAVEIALDVNARGERGTK
jgi:hypothetical protein